MNEEPEQRGITINISGVPMTRPSDVLKRLTMILWGDAGVGKTTLAATAPGRKCWFNFDPEGPATLAPVIEYEDIYMYDLSALSESITEQFKNETNPLNIKQLLDHFDTFVFDSLTNIQDKTLTKGIKGDAKGSSIEHPSPRAYGTRNALAIRLVKNVMAVTSKAKKHVIFIAHEGAPVTDEKTNTLLYITLALGGQLPNNLSIDFSEVWGLYQSDSVNERRVMIRPSRKRKPAKTRMFRQDGDPEFPWKFNADNWGAANNRPYRLDTWFDMWAKTGQKLALPGSKEFEATYKAMQH